jgi:hypothetical protein
VRARARVEEELAASAAVARRAADSGGAAVARSSFLSSRPLSFSLKPTTERTVLVFTLSLLSARAGLGAAQALRRADRPTMVRDDDDAPYVVSLPDAETGRALFREGATLLFLNVPPGTLVGIDGQVRSG